MMHTWALILVTVFNVAVVAVALGTEKTSFDKNCSDLCRDGCSLDLTEGKIAKCEVDKQFCRCNNHIKIVGANDDMGNREKSGDGDHISMEKKDDDSKTSTKDIIIITAATISVSVFFLVIAIAYLWQRCCNKNKSKSTFAEAHRLPKLQSNMILQQPEPLKLRQSKWLPRVNGYLGQMHLYPISPAQKRGPIPGFLIPEFSPIYESLR